MSDDARDPERVVTCTYNVETLTHRFEYDPSDVKVYTYPVKPVPPVRFEHDATARVFRLTAPDGSVEAFRDNPTRYLRVEPDPESGAMRPVIKGGRPVYLYLCREDREAR